jgi:hypothetical protein
MVVAGGPAGREARPGLSSGWVMPDMAKHQQCSEQGLDLWTLGNKAPGLTEFPRTLPRVSLGE